MFYNSFFKKKVHLLTSHFIISVPSVYPLWATEKNVLWSYSESAFFPLLRKRSTITEHTSKFCDTLAMWLNLCDYHKGNRFKTSISLDISSVKNLFLCNVWKLWELLTLSQAMSLISTREWTTISFITIRKGKRKTISSIRKWSVCQGLLNEELIEL